MDHSAQDMSQGSKSAKHESEQQGTKPAERTMNPDDRRVQHEASVLKYEALS